MPIFIDLSKINDIIKEIASQEIMPYFGKLSPHHIQTKDGNSPVTIADHAAEVALIKKLTAYLPGSMAVGEESFAKDNTILRHLNSDAPVWIIDPIDGTRNFITGVPEFAVMVGLVYRGETLAGFIHDPVSGDSLMGERGGGVWMANQRMSLAQGDREKNPVCLIGSRLEKRLGAEEDLMKMIQVEGSSAISFNYARFFIGEDGRVFAGAQKPRINIAIYRRTQSWDHIPGLFLHSEAGGYSADWNGNHYDKANPQYGLLLGSNRQVWEEAHKMFKPLMEKIIEKDYGQV